MPKREPLTTDELSLLRRHIALSRDVLERFARLGEDSTAAQARYHAFEEIIREWLEELADRIERIERLLIVERVGGDNRPIRDEIKTDLESIKTTLKKHIRNLGLLEEQAAHYGPYPPLHLVNQIADEQEIIQTLQERLHSDKKNSAPA